MGELVELVADESFWLHVEEQWVSATIIQFCGDRVEVRYVHPNTKEGTVEWHPVSAVFPFSHEN